MNKQKITPDSILNAIEKTAEMMVKKYEIYENIDIIKQTSLLLYHTLF